MARKIPFHIPTIPKPQQTYHFQINNSNHPFLHPSLPKSEDGSGRPVHPAESFDPVEFTRRPGLSPSSGPTEPLPMESTPFRFVEDVSGLSYLAAKLDQAHEFAVDLEHNAYRSFQGITCLMQFSTRTEDFIVDALKLRPYIGEFLGRFFSDPDKKKVFHGAISDVVWLQRDFEIYVVNMFDTMQASRVLKLERNSLEFLLRYYCGVVANKQYQRSDWRQRPLPSDMVKYAREDTHYLLYIYDLMRDKLVTSGSMEFGFEDPLGEVYKKSQEVCLRLYKKEVFDRDTSYLYLHGLGDANLDSKQLAVVAGLSEWRDRVARQEDESTGYVLPNKDLLEIAKMKPLTKRELLDSVGYSKPFILRDADAIVEIIWAAVCIHARHFEEVAHKLKSGVPVSEIASKIQEMKRLSQEEEQKMAVHHQEMMIYGPRRLARPPMIWVAQPMFGPSGFPIPHNRCHPTIVPIPVVQSHHCYPYPLYCGR